MTSAREELLELGWRVVHFDFVRATYTLERTRRWRKGRYEVVRAEDLARFVLDRTAER